MTRLEASEIQDAKISQDGKELEEKQAVAAAIQRNTTSKNYHIVRISKQLHNIRSLTLRNVKFSPRRLKQETLPSIISMSHKIESIDLSDSILNGFGDVVQLLEASPKLSSITIAWVSGPSASSTNIEADSIRRIQNRLAEHDLYSRAKIEKLEFVYCPLRSSSTMLLNLGMPSFELCLREFSISASEVEGFRYLSSIDAGATSAIETLRLDFADVYLGCVDSHEVITDLSGLRQLKTLYIEQFHLLRPGEYSLNHMLLSHMLSSIPSPSLSSVIFDDPFLDPEWGIYDEGWKALDDSLAQLAKSHPELRVVFCFRAHQPARLHSASVVVLELEDALRLRLSSFLAQQGYAEVTVVSEDHTLYGPRVTKL